MDASAGMVTDLAFLYLPTLSTLAKTMGTVSDTDWHLFKVIFDLEKTVFLLVGKNVFSAQLIPRNLRSRSCFWHKKLLRNLAAALGFGIFFEVVLVLGIKN